MEHTLELTILSQPTETTCGPTCLHAIYQYYNDPIPLQQVVEEIPMMDDGGTLGVQLAVHALERGYNATLYSYNLHLFDPTWFPVAKSSFQQKLKEQAVLKRDSRLQFGTQAYIRFLELGGVLRLEDLNKRLIRKYLDRGVPILAGLNASYLYRERRERPGREHVEDDVGGESSGHFVLLHGYDRETREVKVADPLSSNPMAENRKYRMSMDRVICAILLGIVTYDANLLILTPPEGGRVVEHNL